MKKIIALSALTLVAMSLAGPAQASAPDPTPDLTSDLATPLAFGPGGALGALGNWNANAGHVTLQQTAQVLSSQHDVYNFASGGNVVSGLLP